MDNASEITDSQLVPMQNTQKAQDRVVTSNSIMQMYKQNPIAMFVGANLLKLYNKYKYAKVNKKKKNWWKCNVIWSEQIC